MANQSASTALTSETSSPKNISELCKKLHVATANLVRQSNKLPMLGDGHELYSSFADYAEFMRVQRNRAILLLRRLSNYQCRLNESVLSDGMGPLIGFCDLLVDRTAIALDEYQQSLTRDRIKARQISLGAEQISRGSTSAVGIGCATNAQIVKLGSAADAFIQNAGGATFRDGGGRFAALHKIICHVRDLPLERPSVSSALSVAPAQKRNADEVLGEFDANIITAQRAKLELRLDLSRAYKSMLTMTTADENTETNNNRQRGDGAMGTKPRGTMKKLIEIANRWELLKETNKRTDTEKGQMPSEKSPSNELKKLLNKRMNAIRTVVLIDDDEEDNCGENGANRDQHCEEAERRKDQIRNRIEHGWVSPYDNYVLQKSREFGSTNGSTVNGIRGGIIRATTIVEKLSKKRPLVTQTTANGGMITVEETVEEEEETTKRKRYSHLDEENEAEEEHEKPMVKTEGGTVDEAAEEDEIIVMDAEERTFFADPANLTRKARKRQRKKMGKTADVRLSK